MSRKLGAPGHEPGESGTARRDYIRHRADEQNAAAFTSMTPPTNPEPATEAGPIACPDCHDEVRHNTGCPRIPPAVGFNAGFDAGWKAGRSAVSESYEWRQALAAARADALAEVRRGVEGLAFRAITGSSLDERGIHGDLTCDWDEYLDLIDRRDVLALLDPPKP